MNHDDRPVLVTGLLAALLGIGAGDRRDPRRHDELGRQQERSDHTGLGHHRTRRRDRRSRRPGDAHAPAGRTARGCRCDGGVCVARPDHRRSGLDPGGRRRDGDVRADRPPATTRCHLAGNDPDAVGSRSRRRPVADLPRVRHRRSRSGRAARHRRLRFGCRSAGAAWPVPPRSSDHAGGRSRALRRGDGLDGGDSAHRSALLAIGLPYVLGRANTIPSGGGTS